MKVFTRKTAIFVTTILAALAGQASAFAHSTTEMGPLVSILHEWLHTGGGQAFAILLAIVAAAWMLRGQGLRNNRRNRP